MKAIIESIGSVILVIVVMGMFILGVNSCSANQWNNGVCPKCDERYDCVGVSRGLKYYICQDCGAEIRRY